MSDRPQFGDTYKEPPPTPRQLRERDIQYAKDEAGRLVRALREKEAALTRLQREIAHEKQRAAALMAYATELTEGFVRE